MITQVGARLQIQFLANFNYNHLKANYWENDAIHYFVDIIGVWRPKLVITKFYKKIFFLFFCLFDRKTLKYLIFREKQ